MLVIACAALSIMAGCGGDTPPEVKESSERLTKIQELEDKLRAQGELLAMKDQRLAEQAQELRSLQSGPRQLPINELVHVERIDIDRLSGGYDDDRDGRPDGIRIYLRPIDQFGGRLRAAGTIDIRLLDLSIAPDRQLIAEAKFDNEELKTLWYGALLSNEHYTLTIPWSGTGAPEPGKSITIVATFTELLTGRTFDAQRAVSVTP